MEATSRTVRALVPLALFAGAAVLLFANLGEPSRIYFDETYYVEDARYYLDRGVEESFAVHPPVGKWLIAASIAVFGDDPFGWRAFGALAGALTVLVVYFIGMRLFRRVGPSALAAVLLLTDGLFFAQARIAMLDVYLALFVALGVLLLLVDRDVTEPVRPRWVPVPAGGSTDAPTTTDLAVRDREDEEPPPTRTTLPRRRHGLRGLAGLAFGLAIATKWSGLLALGGAGLLAIGWELARRRRHTGAWLTDWRRGVASIALTLVVLPAGVYLVSYVPWVASYEYTSEGDDDCPEAADGDGICRVGLPGRIAGFARYQKAIWDFHVGLEASHPYRTPAYTWPILARPIVYYWENCTPERASGIPQTDDETGEVTTPEPCVVEEGDAGEILAVGNPALWWSFLALLPFLVSGVVRRDGRAAVVATMWGAQYLPWLIVARPSFLFYMVPNVAFLALGVAYAVRYLDEGHPVKRPLTGTFGGAALGFFTGLVVEALASTSDDVPLIAMAIGAAIGAAAGAWPERWRAPRAAERPVGTYVGVGVALAAVALFVYFFPVWTGLPLDADAIRQRWWFPGWI